MSSDREHETQSAKIFSPADTSSLSPGTQSTDRRVGGGERRGGEEGGGERRGGGGECVGGGMLDVKHY